MENGGIGLKLIFGIELNGESLGDKREALRREKGVGSGGKRRKIREKKRFLREN